MGFLFSHMLNPGENAFFLMSISNLKPWGSKGYVCKKKIDSYVYNDVSIANFFGKKKMDVQN